MRTGGVETKQIRPELKGGRKEEKKKDQINGRSHLLRMCFAVMHRMMNSSTHVQLPVTNTRSPFG